MSFKNLFTVATLLIAISLGSAISATAGEWYTCNVLATGPTGSTSYMQLTDTAAEPAFTGRWFALDPATTNQMLAVAMTAIVNDNTLYVYLNSTAQYQPVSRVYLMKQ